MQSAPTDALLSTSAAEVSYFSLQSRGQSSSTPPHLPPIYLLHWFTYIWNYPPREVTDDQTVISDNVRREWGGGPFISITVSVVVVMALVQGQPTGRAAARVSSVVIHKQQILVINEASLWGCTACFIITDSVVGVSRNTSRPCEWGMAFTDDATNQEVTNSDYSSQLCWTQRLSHFHGWTPKLVNDCFETIATGRRCCHGDR